jgi:hypothetical protein
VEIKSQRLQEEKNQEKKDLWELEPITYIARLFDTEYDFVVEHKFKAICVIQLAGEYAQVMGFHGEVSKTALKHLVHKLKGMGISTIIAERHGKVKTWNLSD